MECGGVWESVKGVGKEGKRMRSTSLEEFMARGRWSFDSKWWALHHTCLSEIGGVECVHPFTPSLMLRVRMLTFRFSLVFSRIH